MTRNSLSVWINPQHLKQKNIDQYQQLFSRNKPFPHLQLKNLFRQEKVRQLLTALTTEPFGNRESDLYTFFQTNDFSKTKNKALHQFRIFLSSSVFVDYISRITGQKLKYNSIDMSASAYERTHYLLPHDDQVEWRRIAYSFYLTSLNKSDGGALAVYGSEKNKPTTIVKKICPTVNTFVFFLVSKKSFHEVEEVITNKRRLAISGWFHHD